MTDNAGTAPEPVPSIRRIRYPDASPYYAGLFKEGARTLLAVTFALAFLVTLVCSFVGAMLGPGKWAAVRDWLQIMLPAETGLFGSALGFYFGSSSASGCARDDS
jgi:hypothetical protein